MRHVIQAAAVFWAMGAVFLPTTSLSRPPEPDIEVTVVGNLASFAAAGDREWNIPLLDELEIPDGTDIRRVSAHGGRAALSLADGRLVIVDVTDPSNMILGQILDLGNPNPISAAAGDGIAVVVYDDLGLWVLDWANPQEVQIVGRHVPPYLLRSVFVSGDFAYVAAFDFGLLIYDIADPTAPTIVGTWAIDQPGEQQVLSVLVDGNVALVNWGYWSDWDFDFHQHTDVLDISDPSEPIRTAQMAQTDRAAFANGIVAAPTDYVDNVVRVYSLADPSDPTLLGELVYEYTHPFPWGINGPYLYVAGAYSQLAVADLSNPSSPVHEAVAMVPHDNYSGAVDEAVFAAQLSTLRSYQRYDEEPVEVEDLGPGNVAMAGNDWRLSCYPNPLNPRTTVSFQIPIPGLVEVCVFDSRGRRVASLYEGFVDVGRFELSWSGFDRNGHSVPSGTYFVKISANERELVRPLTVVR